LANPEHLAKLKAGVEPWRQWWQQNPEVRPDLSGDVTLGASLVQADLHGADLDGANLRGVDLREAN
jgi:uncharacterized protein YjbI with pentapeptide repeats